MDRYPDLGTLLEECPECGSSEPVICEDVIVYDVENHDDIHNLFVCPSCGYTYTD